MKLLHYTYQKLSLWLLGLMAVWGVLFYYTIIYEVMDETDDALENYAQIIINNALYDASVLETEGNLMSFYYFHPISVEEGENYRDMFYDSFVYVESEDENEPVRVYRTAFRMPGGQFYELELMISTLERDDMVNAMFWYLAALFVLFLSSTTIGIRLILQKIFRPLNRLVDWLQQLHPGQDVPPLDNTTEIREFRVLGATAYDMARRNRKAYEEQKQFIENASHELQTPLAVLGNRIEWLLDNTKLNENQVEELFKMQRSLGHIVRLNKTLLLLTKIENGQFPDTTNVSFSRIVDNVLDDYKAIYSYKDIQVEVVRDGDFECEINEQLASMLVTNLLKNAFVHTEEGTIRISISAGQFAVSNGPSDEALDGESIFHRFNQGKKRKNESTGLGLTIVRSICEQFGLTVNYSFVDSYHTFRIAKNR